MSRGIPIGIAAVLAASILAPACGGSRPATDPSAARVRIGDHEKGYASWYGPDYHGRATASGERYNMFDLTAAHRTLPFGTLVRVDNLDNDRSVTVRINDRGPFVRGRIIDLSYKAARAIDASRDGTIKVRIEVVGLPGDATPSGSEGVDLQDVLEDAVGVVPLAE